MKKFASRMAIIASVAALPLLALAQGGGGGGAPAPNLTGLTNLALGIQTVISYLIPAAFALAVLAFFWGVARYIFSAGEEEAKAEGRRIMVGGIIAIFVIAAIWGIVQFIGSVIGINTTVKSQDVPTVTGQKGITP